MHVVNKAYYHLRWTRIPRDSGKGLTITNTQQSSMQSQHLMNRISIPLLANVHCLVETQDIQYTSGDIEIRINFSETICFYKMSISVKQFGSTKCRLSGYRLRRMSAPWNVGYVTVGLVKVGSQELHRSYGSGSNSDLPRMLNEIAFSMSTCTPASMFVATHVYVTSLSSPSSGVGTIIVW